MLSTIKMWLYGIGALLLGGIVAYMNHASNKRKQAEIERDQYENQADDMRGAIEVKNAIEESKQQNDNLSHDDYVERLHKYDRDR